MGLKNVSPLHVEIRTALKAATEVLELRWCNEPSAACRTPVWKLQVTWKIAATKYKVVCHHIRQLKQQNTLQDPKLLKLKQALMLFWNQTSRLYFHVRSLSYLAEAFWKTSKTISWELILLLFFFFFWYMQVGNLENSLMVLLWMYLQILFRNMSKTAGISPPLPWDYLCHISNLLLKFWFSQSLWTQNIYWSLTPFSLHLHYSTGRKTCNASKTAKSLGIVL